MGLLLFFFCVLLSRFYIHFNPNDVYRDCLSEQKKLLGKNDFKKPKFPGLMGICHSCIKPENHSINRLMSIDISHKHNVTSCNGKSQLARVIDIYDGDTITIALDTPTLKKWEPEIYKLRLVGIDAPECKPRLQNPLRNIEKHAANLVTKWLKLKIFGKIVFVKFYGEEKYGRRLGEIFMNEHDLTKSINDEMLELGLVNKYTGKTKTSFQKDVLISITSKLKHIENLI